MRPLLAVALLTSLLSGCTAISADGPAVGSAADWQPAADRAARHWAEDAVLVTADATELDDRARAEFADELSDAREEYEEERAEAKADGDDEAMEEFDEEAGTVERFFDLAQRVVDTPDPQVGDGRATVWSFTYTAASMPGDGYFVSVARGHVVFQDSDEGLGWDVDMDDEPLGNWSIDSDDAADAAALGNADYSRLRDGRNVASHASLVQGAGGPLWSIGIETQEDTGDEEDEAYVAIDATDGSLVKDEIVFIEPDLEDIVEQELGRSQGSFIASVGTSQSVFFDVIDGRHLELAIEASVSPAPVQPIKATLTDPLGAQFPLDLTMGSNPSRASASALLPAVPNGTYALEFEVPLSAYSSWRMSWCTDGTPQDYEDVLQAPACQMLSQSGGGSGGETLSRPLRWRAAWLR